MPAHADTAAASIVRKNRHFWLVDQCHCDLRLRPSSYQSIIPIIYGIRSQTTHNSTTDTIPRSPHIIETPTFYKTATHHQQPAHSHPSKKQHKTCWIRIQLWIHVHCRIEQALDQDRWGKDTSYSLYSNWFRNPLSTSKIPIIYSRLEGVFLGMTMYLCDLFSLKVPRNVRNQFF